MSRGTCPLLLVVLALSFAGGCGARLDPKWQGLPPLADEPLVEQDPEIQKLANQFAKAPQSDAARLAYIRGLGQRGRFPEAVALLASAVRDHPRDDRAATALLETTRVLGAPRELVARFCQGILAGDPTNQGALWVLGEVLLAGNQVRAAEVYLERAWRQEPKSWRPALSLARLTSLQGRQDEARRWCARAAQAVPEEYEAKAHLAEACLQAGMVDEALASARDAARLGSEHPQSASVLAQALLVAGRPNEAIGVLTPAIARGAGAIAQATAAQERARQAGRPGGNSLAYVEGLQRGRYQLLGEAYLALATAPTGPPDLDQAYRDFDRARGALENALANGPGAETPGKVSLYLARVYGALAAIEDARAADRPNGDDATSREELVKSLRAKAIEQYDRALQGSVEADSADGVTAYNDLAFLYAEGGHHLDRALDLAETAVDLRPSPETYDTLGWVQYQRADYSAAIESLLKAQQLAPDSAEILRHLALAYRRDGQSEQSRALLEKALALTEGKRSMAGLRKRIEAEQGDPKAG